MRARVSVLIGIQCTWAVQFLSVCWQVCLCTVVQFLSYFVFSYKKSDSVAQSLTASSARNPSLKPTLSRDLKGQSVVSSDSWSHFVGPQTRLQTISSSAVCWLLWGDWPALWPHAVLTASPKNCRCRPIVTWTPSYSQGPTPTSALLVIIIVACSPHSHPPQSTYTTWYKPPVSPSSLSRIEIFLSLGWKRCCLLETSFELWHLTLEHLSFANRSVGSGYKASCHAGPWGLLCSSHGHSSVTIPHCFQGE